MDVERVDAVQPPPEPAPQQVKPEPRAEPVRPPEPPAPQPDYTAQNVDLFA
jgi:hypothetical protein